MQAALNLPLAKVEPSIHAEALFKAGMMAMNLAELTKAETYLVASLSHYQRLNQAKGLAECYLSLGVLHYRWGHWETSENYLFEAEKVAQNGNDIYLLARIANQQGRTALTNENLTTARHYYEKALTLMRQLGQPRGVAIMLNNLGVLVANESNDYEQALHYLAEWHRNSPIFRGS